MKPNVALLITVFLLSSCSSQTIVKSRAPSSTENCVDLASGLVLSPEDAVLEKFRQFLSTQEIVNAFSDSEFERTLSGADLKTFSKNQYKTAFSKKMDELMAAREIEADKELTLKLENHFIEFMKKHTYVSAEASLANFFPNSSYPVRYSVKVSQIMDRFHSSPEFLARMQHEFDRIAQEASAKSPLEEWIDLAKEVTPKFKTMTQKNWAKFDDSLKDDFIELVVDLGDTEVERLKVEIISLPSLSSADSLNGSQKTMFEKARSQILREMDDLQGDNFYIDDSLSISVEFVQTSKGELLGARLSYSAQAKNDSDEILTLVNSGNRLNFDSAGKLLSDPGNMAPIPND